MTLTPAQGGADRLVQAAEPSFAIDVAGTTELGHDDRRVAALVTVTAGSGGAAARRHLTEVIVMDRSMSMNRLGKLQEAKRATRAAVDALHDGAAFAIVAGENFAEHVYPVGGGLATAGPVTKAEAKLRVDLVRPRGGTQIGQWLTYADRLFAAAPDGIRHAVLYTDGINEKEAHEVFVRALRSCRDHFVCDVRGLGADWDYDEVRHIADTLHGSVEAIVEIGDLSDDFTRLMARVQGLAVPRAYLRLGLDGRFRLKQVVQEHPDQVDLTDHQISRGDGVIDIPLGAWGAETREYVVRLDADSADLPVGEDLAAVFLDLVAGAELETRAAQAVLVVRRSPYPGSATLVPAELTRVEKTERLRDAIRAGVPAYERGDEAAAVRELGAAYRLALELGDGGQLDRISQLIIVDDEGGVRLREGAPRGDQLVAITYSTRHRRAAPAPKLVPASAPIAVRCPHCGTENVGTGIAYCEECGHPIGGTGH